MAVRIRVLAATAVAATALLAPAANAGTNTAAADKFVASAVEHAQAEAIRTKDEATITVPGTDGYPCFEVSVLGPYGAVWVRFYRPVVHCLI